MASEDQQFSYVVKGSVVCRAGDVERGGCG
jgi:hypothetical protein